MASGKPKLSPESIIALLEIGSKRAENKTDQKLSVFDFFKLLSVSKSFLNISRKASYNIYHLDLGYHQLSDSIEFSINSKAIDFSTRAKLSVEHAQNLVKFLQPPYFNVNLCHRFFETTIEKLTDLLQNTDGKIALKTGGFLEDEKIQAYKFINQFMPRIYEFSCNAEFLDAEEPYPFPLLDRLSVFQIDNSSQLTRILRYNIKALKLAFWTTFGILETSVENTTVKKLELEFEHAKYDDVKQMTIDSLKLFPSVKHFDIKASVQEYTNSANEIPDLIFAYGQCVEDLKARFANSLSYMSIEATFYFYANEEGTSWTQKVRENAIFSKWDITFDSDSGTLTMKLLNDKCNLTIVAAEYFQGEEEFEFLDLDEDEERQQLYIDLHEDLDEETNFDGEYDSDMGYDDY